jgi:hypothetical protein
MTNIINNYSDSSFGNSTILFDETINGEANPFFYVPNQEPYNLGFGSSNSNITTATTNIYRNDFSFNFGSKSLVVQKLEKSYKYEEIYERGSRQINQGGDVDIRLKNKLITTPVFLCTPIASNKDTDTSLYVEKINNNTFKVFNTCNNTINVAYIAVQNNTIISTIPENVVSINLINKVIKKSLS